MKSIITIFSFFISVICSFTATSQCTTNYLINPDFEVPVQTNLGNNFPVTVPNWNFPAGTPNLIKVNGSNYYGGPNTANSGTQYLDIVSANGSIEQNFTLSCASTITFSGAFSSREVGRNWTAMIEIVNSSNVTVATSTTRNFTTADADNNTPPGPDAIWYTVTGSASLAAGTYKFKVDLDDFGNFDNAFLCATPGCVLPLKLVSFNVSEDGNCKSVLHWVTNNELNVNRYEVEYGFDGTNFNYYGNVKAKNLYGGADYRFTADVKADGTVYYRLKMIDENGQYKYSGIVKAVKSCGTAYGGFSLQSNIVSSYADVNVNAAYNNNTLQLFDAKGQLVFFKNMAQGYNRVDVSKLAAGVYFVKLGDGNSGVQKLVKIN